MNDAASLEQAVRMHRPLGEEHPYLAGPMERTPRYPLAGEAVTLGIRAAPQVEAVSVRWTLNDAAQETVQAQRVPGSADLWQATLPPPRNGSHVGYWIEAQGANAEGPFTYQVAGWQADSQASIRWQSIKPGVWEGR